MFTPSPISATPGSFPDDRPPIGTVPQPGVAEPFDRIRPTVHDRPMIWPVVWAIGDGSGFPLDHPYVRRYWVPVLGPGAIADLLRLATAAARGRPLPRPRHLTDLGRAGLVRTEPVRTDLGRTDTVCNGPAHAETGVTTGMVMVRTRIPPVPAGWRQRLPPRLRRELDAGGRPRSPLEIALS